MSKKIILISILLLTTSFIFCTTFQNRVQSDTWYSNGQYLFDKGKYLKSVECLEKALSLNAKNDKARNLMEQVIKMAKHDINAKNNKKKTKVNSQKKVRIYSDFADSRHAEIYMNKVLVNKVKSNLFKNRTQFKYLSKYLKKANGSEEKKKEIAKELNTSKAKDFNQKGMKFAKDGKFEKAVEEFKKALNLDPYNVETHVNLGLAYAYTDRLYDAIKEYKMVIKLAEPKSKEYKIASSMIEKLKAFI